jgi:hypothetical protein
LKNTIGLISVVVFASIFTMQQQEVYGWVLNVELTAPIVSDYLSTTVSGPFGYDRSKVIDYEQSRLQLDSAGSAAPVTVDFDIPETEIPVGHHFRVCSTTHAFLGTGPCADFLRDNAGDLNVSMNLYG